MVRSATAAPLLAATATKETMGSAPGRIAPTPASKVKNTCREASVSSLFSSASSHHHRPICNHTMPRDASAATLAGRKRYKREDVANDVVRRMLEQSNERKKPKRTADIASPKASLRCTSGSTSTTSPTHASHAARPSRSPRTPKHLRVHSGDKPHSCQACDMAFVQRRTSGCTRATSPTRATHAARPSRRPRNLRAPSGALRKT